MDPAGCTQSMPWRVCIMLRFGEAPGALGKALQMGLLLSLVGMKEQNVEVAGVGGAVGWRVSGAEALPDSDAGSAHFGPLSVRSI